MRQTENRQTDNVKHLDTHPLMVSIRCITYNHEPYIRQCLEGFVMQKTNFRFEAIVHDDASTDGTATIIREYAEKYPDIIKPIYETENQYSKHDGSLRRIMDEACTGKYIALCEGDDYWTDPNKLQQQVDFMESHPDYSMCFHRAIEHWEDGFKEDSVFSEIEDREYSGIEIFDKWTIPTASVLFRQSVFQSQIYKEALSNDKFIYGDTILFLSCYHCGRIKGLSEVMSVYRRHKGSMTANFNVNTKIRFAYHCLEVYHQFGIQYKKSATRQFFEQGMISFFYSRNMGNPNYPLLLDLFKYAPIKTFNAIITKIKEKLL